MTTILIVALVGFVLGAAGMRLLWKDNAELEHRLTVVETKQAEDEERRKQLENIKTWKHYSYNQRAGFQDAIAVLIGALTDNDAEAARIRTAINIVGSIYKTPESYDPEKGK